MFTALTTIPKTYFSTYVHRHKSDIFESAASAIRTGLARIVQSVDRILRRDIDNLAKKVSHLALVAADEGRFIDISFGVD